MRDPINKGLQNSHLVIGPYRVGKIRPQSIGYEFGVQGNEDTTQSDICDRESFPRQIGGRLDVAGYAVEDLTDF